MTSTYTLKSPAILRKGLRAYLGLHVTAFDVLVTQSKKAQALSQTRFEGYAVRGTKIEDGLSAIFSKTPKFVRRATPCGMATTMGLLPKKNAADAKVDVVVSKKTVTPAKKAVAEKTTKVVAKKAVHVETKTETKIARHIPYYQAVLTYDASASEDVVRKIVNHCGIALSNNDGKFVACSDESERATVRDSWLVNKLGMTGTDLELDAKVMAVCETMKADRMKSRVTFYYLLAKTEGKLNTL